MPALQIKNLRFRYASASDDIIRIPEFRIERGETVFMFGPSGSGKTTLLSLIAGLFKPNEGSVSVLGRELTSMGAGTRDRFRAKEIGFIFQIFNLIPYLSVIQNVLLPCKFGRSKSNEFPSEREEAIFLLGKLGLQGLENQGVTRLSIGQQQRVAASRALMGSPGLIIADEPTSALDAEARTDFLKMLFEQAKREKSAVLFVSHDRSLSSLFDRTVALSDVNLVSSKHGGRRS